MTIENARIETTGKTYRTTDYDLFKRLEGNRDVLASRVNKIRKSIQKYGYIYNPIVVNEKYEIVDGQGRFEALRTEGLPIDFVIAHGAGLNECVALNASGTIWTMKDYIASYCEQGNENYIRMRDLMNDFPELPTAISILLITGLSAVPNETIKSGRMVLTENLAEEARKSLNIAMRFKGTLSRVKGTPVHYFYTVVFAIRMGADEKRLFETVERSELPPGPNLKSTMDSVSDIYNKGLKDSKKRIYLNQEYEQTMTKKYGWYAAKWGAKYDS